MLKQTHIDWYRTDVVRSARVAMAAAQTAERIALLGACNGCRYCEVISRHKGVLGNTKSDLLLVIDSLHDGDKTTFEFPRKMFAGYSLYRGFITVKGEYVDLFQTNHDEYRRKVIAECGEEEAYRMITVHSSSLKNQVHFFDRKYPPTQEQYATLRELMVSAEGDLCFRFEYDTTHPHK